MAVLLLVLWLLAFLTALGLQRPVRESALAALTGVTILLVLVTEALSLVAAITPMVLAGIWGALCVAVAVAARKYLREGAERLGILVRQRRDAFFFVTAGVLGILGIGTLLSAVLYPATNGDSLTYHMPRVFFWFQNHSVAYFPTPEARQLFSSPLAEYAVLHLQTLSFGSDRLASLVQWVSYLFSIAAVSLIAEELGATVRGQQVAAITAATVPMAVLQASTTQNDLTCALWSLMAVFCVAKLGNAEGRADRLDAAYVAWAGAATALAVLAKAPAYLVIAPFVLWLAVHTSTRQSWRRAAMLAVCFVLSFAALTAGSYLRNAHLLGGDFLGLSAEANSQTLIRKRDPVSLVTTGVKNTAMLLGTPVGAWNAVVARSVRTIVGWSGSDLEDPATRFAAWDGPYEVPATPTNHDSSPAAATFGLVSIAMVGLLARARRTATRVWKYGACAVVGFALCAGLIAWQPWVNRLLLPALMVLLPLVGAAFGTGGPRTARAVKTGLTLLLGASVFMGLFAMVFNGSNPLAPRFFQPRSIPSRTFWNTSFDGLRFKQVPDLQEPFTRIAETVDEEGIRRIAIRQEVGNFPIYPLLTLMPDVTFGYVGPDVLAASRMETAADFDAVLAISDPEAGVRLVENAVPNEDLLLPAQRGSGAELSLYRAR